LAARLVSGLRITFDAAVATFFEVFLTGDFRCDNALAADFFAFLLAAGLLNTLPARLATLRPVPLIAMMLSLYKRIDYELRDLRFSVAT
jgi:hypothetical protein